MRWRRAVGILGLVCLTLLAGGCSEGGTGVAGPVPRGTTPAGPDGGGPPAGGPSSTTGKAAGTGGK